MSLVSLKKKKKKKKKKENRWKQVILTDKFLISSERLEVFQWNFQERCDFW